jgi:hypothetical protein
MRLDHRIVDVAARQHVGDLVANQFADAQLTLRAAGRLFALVVTWHFCISQAKLLIVMPGLVPGIHVLNCHCQ